MRFHAFRLLAWTCCGMFWAAWACAEPRPNILLLVAEDLSARVGAFGDPLARTPNIDALAREGVRYPNTFTTAGVCAPSRAALITGMHQESIGAQHMRAVSSPRARYLAVPPPEVRAFPEYLRAAGYYTFTDRKLDYQFSGVQAGSGPFTIWDAEGEGSDWQGRADGQPFFGMINLLTTHESALFAPTQELAAGSWQGALVASLRSWQRVRNGADTDPQSVSVPPYYPDTPEVRAGIATHYDNVAVMDDEVGGWMQRLREEHLLDDTIVIWTTDHGDALPRAKREVFDSGIRVPMVLRIPGAAAAGGEREQLVSFVDLAPTILGLAGITVPGHLHGRDFLKAPPRQYIYAARDRIDEQDDRVRAVRDARFKYLRYYQPGTPGAVHIDYRDQQPIMAALWEAHAAGTLSPAAAQWFAPRPVEALYDVQGDPHELHNLAFNPDFAEVLGRMREALAARPQADLSEFSEADMAAQFWPDGRQPVTESVTFQAYDAAHVALRCATPGAAIAYRASEQASWRVYSTPLPANSAWQAKAVRYGWQESAVTQYHEENQRGD